MLKFFYVLIGLLLAGIGFYAWKRQHRFLDAAFWWTCAIGMAFADTLSDEALGVIFLGVIVLTALRAAQPGASAAVKLSEPKPAPQLVVAAGLLMIPLGTLLIATALRAGVAHGIIPATFGVSLIAFSMACLLAGLWAWAWLKPTGAEFLNDTYRVFGLAGWSLVLPLALGVYGAALESTGVGESLARLVAAMPATQSKLSCVVAYCWGMAVAAVLLGNAFVAYPLVTASVGLPLVVLQHGGNPAVVASFGMLCGYCGALVSPLAGNFNHLPVALLNLNDRQSVIKAQMPTAVIMLLFLSGALFYLA